MHLLPITSISLDESESAIDLDQAPGDIVALSFTDSDLSALAAAYRKDEAQLPSLRLASLKQLRHPLSVDLYAEKTVTGAKFVLVRCLGGLDYWRYGLERLRDVCTERGVKLAVLPGDDRPDERLAAFSTVAPALVHETRQLFPRRWRRQHAGAAAASCGRDRIFVRTVRNLVNCRAPSRGRRKAERSISRQHRRKTQSTRLSPGSSSIDRPSCRPTRRRSWRSNAPCANADCRPSFLPSRA